MCCGLLCFVPFLIPSYQSYSIDNGTEERFTIGLPQSPWFIHTTTDTKVEIKSRGMSSVSMNSAWTTNVEFVSWSAFFLVAAIVLLMVSRILHKKSRTAL